MVAEPSAAAWPTCCCEHQDRLAHRAGRSLALRRVVVRDPNKPRDRHSARTFLTDLAAAITTRPSTSSSNSSAGPRSRKKVVLDALAAGKHVVTANKALLADARRRDVRGGPQGRAGRRFEAAVAGGVPIIRALAESLAANQVTAIQGILNGTSNFILTGDGRARA